jgi:hypothetical protein
MCVLIFSIILYEKFLILRRIERNMIKNVFWDPCKLPVIFVRLWNLNFFDIFSKNTQISNFIKIRPVKATFFHMDGRTDKHDEGSDGIILVTRGHMYLVPYFPEFQTSVTWRDAVFWCVTPCRVVENYSSFTADWCLCCRWWKYQVPVKVCVLLDYTAPRTKRQLCFI